MGLFHRPWDGGRVGPFRSVLQLLGHLAARDQRTTIVTFLMVFLIQNSQNRDSAAIQVKLDELIRVSKANNSFMGLEHLTDEELEEVQERCQEHAQAVLAARAVKEINR